MSLLLGTHGWSVGAFPLSSTAAISAIHVLREARSSASRAHSPQRAGPSRRDASCNFSSCCLAFGTSSYMSSQDILACRIEIRPAEKFRGRRAVTNVPPKLSPQLGTELSTQSARIQHCYSTSRGSTVSHEGNYHGHAALTGKTLQMITDTPSKSSSNHKNGYKKAPAKSLEGDCIQVSSEGLTVFKVKSDDKQKKPPRGYGPSWNGYWEKAGGIDRHDHVCAVDICCKDVKEGGQVMVETGSGSWLPKVTGMCQSHNRTGRKYTYRLKLRPGAVLVPIPGSTGWSADHVHEMYGLKTGHFPANKQHSMA